ncbi:hypothetical protein BDN72DRAFT_906268 [Pluteus cervinus]|uniref:Uncharacterized protein n=1 Tax=Pluteus cervinus TaxID=181527 RepID=A0ACD3A234_9AGAR|nr:hypothetical protein BDN72DRAFT_906268 [Pluteus cervinus]
MAIGSAILKCFCASVHILAIAVTVLSLRARCRHHRQYRWEDTLVVFSFLFAVGSMAIVWDLGGPRGSALLGQETLAMDLFWLSTLFFPLVIWTVRLSLACGILHLVDERNITRRRVLYAMTVFFVLLWLAFIFLKLRFCTAKGAWHSNVYVQCSLGSKIGIVTLITDILAGVLADFALAAIPLAILEDATLPIQQRALLRFVFCSTLLGSLAGIASAGLIFRGPRVLGSLDLGVLLAASMEASIVLLVCNALVVASCCYQTCSHEDAKAATASPFDATSLLDEARSLGSGSSLEDAASDTGTHLSWTTIETGSSCETCVTASTCETCATTSTFESALYRRERGTEVAAFLFAANPLGRPHDAQSIGPRIGSNGEKAPLIRHNSLASNYSGINAPSPAAFRNTTTVQLSCSVP